MPKTYIPPDVAATPLSAQKRDQTLNPDTEVTFIFRGGPPIVDMYDQRVVCVPPRPSGVSDVDWKKTFQPAGHFTLPYGIVLHLQGRAIVPGTRNPHDYRRAESQIGILNIDKSERCEPFTSEQMARFGYPDVEGLDRGQFLDGRRDIQVLGTEQGLASAYAAGRDIDGELEAAADEGTDRPQHHDGLQELAAGEREAQRAGERVSRNRPGARFKDTSR